MPSYIFDVILTSYNLIAEVTQGAELYKAERIDAATNAFTLLCPMEYEVYSIGVKPL